MTMTEAERLAILAAPSPFRLPEVVPVIAKAPPDPDAPAPDSMSMDEWMAHENKRQAAKEKERQATESKRDGHIDIADRARAAHRTNRW